MSFLDFLSPALTTATSAAGAYQGAQSQAAQQKVQAVIQQIQMQRQAQEFALQQALGRSTIGKNDSEAFKNTREGSRLQEGDPGYIQYQTDLAGGKAGAAAEAELTPKLQEMVAKGQIDLNTARIMAGVEHGYKAQEIGQEGGIKRGLLGQEYGLKGALQNNEYQLKGGLLGQEYGLKGDLQSNQQKFDQGQLSQRMHAELANRIGAIKQTQSGALVPNLMKIIGKGPLATQATTPTEGIPAAAMTPENATLWDNYVNQGLSPEDATAKVLAGH